MPRITSQGTLCLSSILIGFLLSIHWACSSPNSEAPSSQRVHSALYLLEHRAEAQAAPQACAVCHGTDYQGGGQVPSCFDCHPDEASITLHAMPYRDPAAHGASARKDLAKCRGCHVSKENVFDGGILADESLYASEKANCLNCHSAAGAHPTRWQGENSLSGNFAASHRLAGNLDTACILCHDVTRGRSAPNSRAPSCFSNRFFNAEGVESACHANGPGVTHPLPYTDAAQHGVDAKADLGRCVPCHAQNTESGTREYPRFNVPVGALENGCEDCHEPNTAHPVPLWTGPAGTSHKSAQNMETACAMCHGNQLDGETSGGIGPACSDCHTNGSPLNLVDCSSCHTAPPSGDQRPNRNESHTAHQLLAGGADRCEICHDQGGSNSRIHYDSTSPADIGMPAAYNARSGSASYNSSSQTCSNVICHGGQTTPSWRGGSIEVDTDCDHCHRYGNAQYNGYYSGGHGEHEGMACTQCHDTAALAVNHFSDLTTTAFDGDPADTIRSELNYTPDNHSGCAISGCHGTENW